MTRIVAGAAGGRRLKVPPGETTRPTSDRVREALFSALEAAGAVAGARVLDLYAGSGALGLEAASRGAAQVVLVEAARAAAATARANAGAVGLPGVRVVADRVERFLASPAAAVDGGWDLVLVDPPYAVASEEVTAVLAALAPLLAPGAVVVVERSSRTAPPAWPEPVTDVRERRYGETTVWVATCAPPGPGTTAV
ncbi:16S rRNA (guanine(966)-N(2))-methyltransferase RsmD [Kineococcus sp. SYSU DK002]|uniref:16S rRNA (guanine(966)-N(2))-methyltransferase RsmD n=1 Tax=Kineococcus sp. SYSU DK002 TaxID=3383123 RepID=UPI003D7EE7FA